MRFAVMPIIVLKVQRLEMDENVQGRIDNESGNLC